MSDFELPSQDPKLEIAKKAVSHFLNSRTSIFDLKFPGCNRFGTKLRGYEAWADFLERKGSSRTFSFSNQNLMTNCPFHDDEKASFGLIHTSNKQAYNCFGCGETGSLRQLVTELTGDPKAWMEMRDFLKPDDYDYVPKPRSMYSSSGYSIESLNLDYRSPCEYWQNRGLSESTVKKYELGANSDRFKLMFPVWDVVLKGYVGICEREWDTQPNYPDIRREGLKKGFTPKYYFKRGIARGDSIFGANLVTDYDELYVFESAIDCMNHEQRTGKPSVATWGKEISDAQLDYLAQFQHVILCPDKDFHRGGLSAAEKAERRLSLRTKVSIALLKGPFTDYSEAVVAGIEIPELKLLPPLYKGRYFETEKLYRTFKQSKKGKSKK